MNMLTLLDSYALKTMTDSADQFIITLVESKALKIYSYKDKTTSELVHMPNWAYSYALALYRLHRIDDATKELTKAIKWFPSVPLLLIQCSISSKFDWSFLSQWKYHPTPPQCLLIIDIFNKRNAILWS